MPSVRASPLPSRPLAIVPERLESCVRRLDPADRALLDLSLNRGIPDAAMAPILRTDPLRLAWKRARAIERVASRLGLTHPADLGLVRTALADLPSRAWLPLELQPAKQPRVLEPPEPVGEEPRVMKPSVQPAATVAPPEPAGAEPRVTRPAADERPGGGTAPATPPEPPGAEPVVFRAREPEAVRASLRAAAQPGTALAPARPAQAAAGLVAKPVSTYGRGLATPARAEDSGVQFGRAASFTLGGLSERAKRAYPRGGMTTRARRAAGALAVGAAALLALRRS
ncbi:MAG TPA: hypothetical protein VF517_16855 [Thermoleophilaceae bacterium]|jgi:hypothetical protein